MLYMVEMDLPDRSKIDAWHAWYEMHIRKLLALPGFHGSQRFFSLTATASPFLAIHHVDGPQFFDSEAYKKVGGPTGTGEWQSRMTNWYRNLFDHPGGWPEVAMADRLAVVDRDAQLPGSYHSRVTWMTSAGLDRSADQRGLLLVPTTEDPAALVATDGVRLFKPITAKFT